MRKSAVYVFSALLALVISSTSAKDAAEHWVATWAASPSPAHPDAAQMQRRKLEFNEQTMRAIVHITLGGERFRVRLSNAFGTKAVEVGGVHIALRKTGAAIDESTDRPLTFSGRKTVSIPPGAVVLSDPAELKAPASADLAISMYLPGGPTIASTVHYSAQQTSYAVAGDKESAADMSTETTIACWPYLVGVDVMAPQTAATVVTLGDSITDGSRSTTDTNRRWPNILADRLQAQKKNELAVVNAGIGGNRILHDGAGGSGPQYGPSALARLDRDVLSQPGVKYVIVLEGVNDIGHPGGSAPISETVTAEDMIAGLRQVIERSHEKGLKVFGGTIMPFTLTPSAKEEKRQAVNEWIRNGKAFDGVIDFDKAVRDPAQPIRMAAPFDSGDHLHPNDAGHKAMGEVVDLKLFGR